MSTKKISVPFRIETRTGWDVYRVECMDSKTLTASGIDLKISCECLGNLYLRNREKAIEDRESVVLERDGSTTFISTPNAKY